MTDIELIRLCREGDKSAWEELCRIYKPIVLQIARRFFLSGGDTEDLVQEGMCGLLSAVCAYQSDEKGFSPYAYCCIRNKIKDAVKKSIGDKQSALNNFVPIDAEGKEWISPNPEDEIILKEHEKELLKQMAKFLSPFEYQVITLYIEGSTMTEISATLNKSTKSIDNAITRAKQKLQKNISSES